MGNAAPITNPELEASSLVAGRYQVRGMLGRGGMAAVYDVIDTVRGSRCALKRLQLSSREGRRAALLTLFEREFLTLSQLQHPNVVSAYDYGIDEGVPYYTMELVTGADLQARVPLPWPTACRVARDLCSVLALLHSRRLIYRDLNPRNVRSTPDGSTKLIDFGAMSPMGSNRQLVGTPAFCAPEAVRFQPLDGRTDLYALGVMLYLMLTGRVPFFVRDFAQLRAQHPTQPPPPSTLAADIPPALEQLVLDLVRSDPALRPANAAEVIDRLNAIAGLASDDAVTTTQAYLTTPNLVARGLMLAAVRDELGRALARKGSSLVVTGAGGSGRSRMLAACELEAKLQGLAVLRADLSDAGVEDYAVARALVSQLFELAPDLMLSLVRRDAAVLVHVLPELHERIDGIAPKPLDADQLDRAVQPLLRQLLIEVSRRQALMIAVDDVDRLDASSAALLTLLAQEVASAAIVLVTALDGTAITPANMQRSIELLTSTSRVIVLEPLAADATQSLLGSVFGEVPNLPLLARRLQAISQGNPRDLMQLAQHLVDRGVLRYRNGSWTIPDDLDALDLPSGMAQALRTRVEMLSPHARTLAQTIAQCPGRRFAFEECVAIAAQDDRWRVMQALDELLAAGVMRLEGGQFALAQQAWVATLADALTPEARQACNGRLAELFASQHDEFRTAQHWLRAGQTERGLALLVEHAISSRKRTDQDLEAFSALLRALPDDWLATYEHALELCAQRKRPYSEVYALRTRLCGILSSATSTHARTHFAALVDDLVQCSGLDLFAAMDPALPLAERLKRALGGAQQRYEAKPPAERTEDPAAAIRELARVAVQTSGIVALGFDYALAQRLPSFAPLALLNPALAVIDQLVLGVIARISGQPQRALHVYTTLIRRISEPDRGGLDPAHHLYTVMGIESAIGMLEAVMGLDSCLARATRVEEHAHQHMNALHIRMLHALWQGRAKEAAQRKREAELARIEATHQYHLEGGHLLGELTAYALTGELTGLKQVSIAIERRAQTISGWLPVHHYARAEFHRLCGNAALALTELETALALLHQGRHQIWIWVAAAHVRTLLELGRVDEACAQGKQYLTTADERELGYTRNYVRMPFSLALAQRGQHAEAAWHAGACLDELAALGVSGLHRMLALETRASIAIRAGDRAGLEGCLRALDTLRWAGDDAMLVATRDRVIKEARRAELLSQEEGPRGSDEDAASASSRLVRSTMEACDTIGMMTRASLELLVRSTGSPGGVLYSINGGALELEAEVGTLNASDELLQFASDFLASELQQDQATVVEEVTSPAKLSAITWAAGAKLCPVALHHIEAGRYTVVAVVIMTQTRSAQIPNALVSELSRTLFKAGLTGTSSG